MALNAFPQYVAVGEATANMMLAPLQSQYELPSGTKGNLPRGSHSDTNEPLGGHASDEHGNNNIAQDTRYGTRQESQHGADGPCALYFLIVECRVVKEGLRVRDVRTIQKVSMTHAETHPLGKTDQVNRGELAPCAGPELQTHQGRRGPAIRHVFLPEEEGDDHENTKDEKDDDIW